MRHHVADGGVVVRRQEDADGACRSAGSCVRAGRSCRGASGRSLCRIPGPCTSASPGARASTSAANGARGCINHLDAGSVFPCIVAACRDEKQRNQIAPARRARGNPLRPLSRFSP